MLERLCRGISRQVERGRVRFGYGLDRLGIDGLDNGHAWRERKTLPKTAIICGSAPSLIPELGVTHPRRPDAFIIAVNQAAQLAPADVIFTQHPEQAARFLKLSKNGSAEVHMGKFRRFAKGCPISVYWPECVQGVTSGASAVHVACMMRFSEIILCGLPMEGGDGYAPGLDSGGDGPRFGTEPADSAYVESYRQRFMTFVSSQGELLKPVRSCGGWTRELFGGPDWQG